MKKRLIALLTASVLLLAACGVPAALSPAEEAAPAAAESPAPAEGPAASEAQPAVSYEGKLRIAELMVKNRATLAAEDGGFYDWIELENVSAEPVTLDGWAIADGPDQKPWPLPARTLAPGERLLVFAAGEDASAEDAPFSLSVGESVCLFAPSGALVDELIFPELQADESYALDADGQAVRSYWATPGFPNTDAGYEAFAASRAAAGPLVISEVTTAQYSYPAARGAERKDWVEIRNVSDRSVSLRDYLLRDKDSEPFRLPDRTLAPGETALIVCGGDGAEDAPFSLDADWDCLFLGTESGLCDYLVLHDLPIDGSCGRLDGEEGFFYFTEPTPGAANRGGWRMVSAAPETLTEDGIYDDVDFVSVSLSAPGRIYYTLDGSRPGAGSALLDGSLSLTGTTVLRAFAQEDGKAPSPVVTQSFIINEHHSLPVVSLSLDNPALFRTVYMRSYKDVELPGCISLFDNGLRFTQACGMELSGSGSLSLPKKSMAIQFRSCYGDGSLNCDLFDSGVDKYASLQIRAGEANPTTIIKSDLFQDLCLDMASETLTQHSKYCIVYVNGSYYGIYCLKEKFSAQYYASLKGVSKSSVTVIKYPAAPGSAFSEEVLSFCSGADLRDPAQYARFCELVNVDSLIDWYLIEGLSGNPDIGGNLRFFRSTEDGGRWSFALYDLDWGFTDSSSIFKNLTVDNNYHTGEIKTIMKAAMQSEVFRDRILSRYASVYDTVLSNEHILERLDAYEQLLAPDISRDRLRWGGSETVWRMKMDALRDFIRDNDPQRLGVERFCEIWDVSPETRAGYFGW